MKYSLIQLNAIQLNLISYNKIKMYVLKYMEIAMLYSDAPRSHMTLNQYLNVIFEILHFELLVRETLEIPQTMQVHATHLATYHNYMMRSYC